MWETRVLPGELDALLEWVRSQAWPRFAAVEGFSGGDVYRSDEDERVVVVTRWLDADALAPTTGWFDDEAARFCAREAHGWVFAVVDV